MANFFKFLFLFVFIISLFSCHKDEPIKEISTFDPNRITLEALNPNSGIEYSLEELSSLHYDVSKENFYDSTQLIQLYLIVPEQAVKAEIRRANGDLFQYVTDFEKANGYKKAIFEFSVFDLALEIFNSTHLTFLVTYEVNEREYAGTVVFKIHHIQKYIPPQYKSPVWLIKSTLDSIEIPVNAPNEIMSYGGKFGTILEHKKGSYVTIDEGNYLNFRHENDFSISIWVNTNINQDDPVIIGDKDWGSGVNPGFAFIQTGKNWTLNTGNNSSRIDISGTDIDDGHWHYLTATFDCKGDVSVFTDGFKNNSADMSEFGNIESGLSLNIAQDGTGNYLSWQGKTAGTYFYDYILTPEEIFEIGASGITLLRSNGKKSPLHVTSSASSKTLEENKVAYYFDGIDDMVTLDTIPELEFRFENDFSVVAWVNTKTNQEDPIIIGDKNWSSGSNPGFLFVQTGNNWKLNLAGVESGTRIDISGNTINDGNWHMLGATFDRKGLVTIYQDGIAVNSEDMSHVMNMRIPENYPIRLGQDGTGLYDEKFEGKIANIIIADFVISAKEMMSLFNE